MANRPEIVEQGGLGKRKSIFVMITVVGCIAILWPKIISPMFASPPPHPVSDGFGTPGCCGIVMNQESSSNVSLNGDLVRSFMLPTSELVFRQERPAHLKEVGIHPAMQERGRAIPPGKGVAAKPPTAAKPSKNSFTYRVDGRPGPIPGLRPQPGGQTNKRREAGGSSSFLLPAYTIGIVVFFVYTLIKLATKNTEEVPAKTLKKNEFKQKVFEAESDLTNKMQFSNKIGWEEHKTKLQDINPIYSSASKDISEKSAASNGIAIAANLDSLESVPLLEISLLKQKLQQTESKMNNIIADMFEEEHQTDCKKASASEIRAKTASSNESNGHDNIESLDSHPKLISDTTSEQNGLNECSVKILGLEVTTSTDVAPSFSPSHAQATEKEPVLQSIFLEGSIGHESNILVKDAETKTDEILSDEDDQMVVLSSKMTLSLINVDADTTTN